MSPFKALFTSLMPHTDQSTTPLPFPHLGDSMGEEFRIMGVFIVGSSLSMAALLICVTTRKICAVDLREHQGSR